MNWYVRRICVNNTLVRQRLLGNLLKMSSVNILGSSFWRLHMGINDTGFIGKVTDMAKGVPHG